MTAHNLDLAAIRRALDEEEWSPSDDGDPHREERRVYLGSVFQLTPSGKYYMPWACSNVAGDCTVCKGTRNTLPRVSRRRAKKIARMLATYAKRTIKRAGTPAHARYMEHHRVRRRRLYVLASTTCARCDGTGSQSAADDERWREAAEEALASIGCWLSSGEGDPCDLFAGESRDREDEDSYRDDEDDSEVVASN